MEFVELAILGSYLLVPERHEDERGFFARSWCSTEFATRGLSPLLAQSNVSYNPRRGTLRGLHYQIPPHQEDKLVTCVRGSVWDVVLDLRRGSATYGEWHAENLDGGNLRSLYIPRGCAHGFLTRSDDTLVLYQISEPFDPSCARGVRWDDPAFGIEWPDVPSIVGERDRSYSDFGSGSPD